jgi:hypothetical protein
MTLVAIDKCPACGQKGRRVQTFTIRSLIKYQSLSAVGNDDYFFCANGKCEVVYYCGSKESVFQKHQLKIRAGLKEKTSQRTLCYCFGQTIEDVHREIRETGISTIEKEISRKIEAGLCHCEDANPEGRCCLGRVADAVKEGFRISGTEQDEIAVSAANPSDCCK